MLVLIILEEVFHQVIYFHVIILYLAVSESLSPSLLLPSIYLLSPFFSKSIQIPALPSSATSHPSVSPTTSTHSLLQLPHPCQDYIPQSRFVHQLPPCRIYFEPILVPEIASNFKMNYSTRVLVRLNV